MKQFINKVSDETLLNYCAIKSTVLNEKQYNYYHYNDIICYVLACYRALDNNLKFKNGDDIFTKINDDDVFTTMFKLKLKILYEHRNILKRKYQRKLIINMRTKEPSP